VKSQPLPLSAQHLIFPMLLFGFGILVSLWPFHTWAPIGYGSAPAGTAMLHAGVLKKFGLYGLIRIALPLMPEAAHSWMNVLAILCLGNIIHCGFVAMRQKDLNLLLGNSSVAHMGFIFLGIATLNVLGITGAVFIMVAHGFLAALVFGLSGYLHQQTGTLRLSDYSGIMRQAPFVGVILVMAFMAGCGLPGFANFAGEVMVLFSAWNSFPVVTSLAIWGGLVIGAIYMLRAIRAIVHGPLNERGKAMADASLWQKVPFLLLVGALLLFGIRPGILVERIRPGVESIVTSVGARATTAVAKTDATRTNLTVTLHQP
jgi:NADH-quinone oxidoreductase subunit M